MASPNGNGNLKKIITPQSPGVRKIPSSFDSPVIHTGQYVVEGAAQRISQTRIPADEHDEPKRTGERRRLKRLSDQPTVLMTIPDGFIDLQNDKAKNAIKSSIAKTNAINPSNQPAKAGPSKSIAVKNDPAINGQTASQKDKLNQLQAQQVTLTCKQLIPTEPKDNTSSIRETFDTEGQVSCSQNSESPGASIFAAVKNCRKRSARRCCPKESSCCSIN